MKHSMLKRATFESKTGSEFQDVAAELKDFAAANSSTGNAIIEFLFVSAVNVEVKLAAGTDLNLLQRDFGRALEGYITPSIGPFWRAQELSEKDKARDRIIEAANAKLVAAASFNVLGSERWDELLESSSGDPLRLAAVVYAVRWARLMQLDIAQGHDHVFAFAVSTAVEAGFPTAKMLEASKIWDAAAEILLEHWGYRGMLAVCIQEQDLCDEMKQMVLCEVYSGMRWV